MTVSGPRLSGAGVPTVVHVPETAADPARLGGTYALLEDGFTLELVEADGTAERRLLLDDGSSRVLDGRRYTFSTADIDSIDLLAIAESWSTGGREEKDWRASIAEAAARDSERRALTGTNTPKARPEPPPKP